MEKVRVNRTEFSKTGMLEIGMKFEGCITEGNKKKRRTNRRKLEREEGRGKKRNQKERKEERWMNRRRLGRQKGNDVWKDA